MSYAYKHLLLMLPLTLFFGCNGDLDANQQNQEPLDQGTNSTATSLGRDMNSRTEMDMNTVSRDLAMPKSDMATQGVDMSLSPEDMFTPPADMSQPVDMATMSTPTPLLVAQGRFGRTTISCDGGKTWVGNRDMVQEKHPRFCGMDQPGIKCGQDAMCMIQKRESDTCGMQKCGCDHLPGSATGLAWGDGWFVTTFGWGTDGLIWRSQDGLVWEDVSYLRSATHAAVAYGKGTFALGSRNAAYSQDRGMTWQAREYRDRIKMWGEDGMEKGRARKIAFLDVDGGIFLMWGDGGAAKSKDAGLTWERVEGWKESCSERASGAVSGNGIVVMTYSGPTGNGDSICVSTDGTKTFETISLGTKTVRSNPLFVDGKFYVWTSYYNVGFFLHTSTDGLTWTKEEVADKRYIRSVAYDPLTKHFVTINDAYDKQEYLYSTDGLTWVEGSSKTPDELEHGIKRIAYGEAPAGFVCPEM